MDTIEKIKEYIENRLEELNPKQGEFAGRPLRKVNPRTFPRESELERIQEFISSLEKGQDVDLEKEIEDWCKENVTGVKPIYTADSLIYGLLPKTARYFYKLGLNARKEE